MIPILLPLFGLACDTAATEVSGTPMLLDTEAYVERELLVAVDDRGDGVEAMEVRKAFGLTEVETLDGIGVTRVLVPEDQRVKDVATLLGGKFNCRIESLLVSENGAPVSATGGRTMGVDLAAHRAPEADYIILCGGESLPTAPSYTLTRWLRGHVSAGRTIGAVESASLLLARLGLLDGRACTTHWRQLEAAREKFPEMDWQRSLFLMEDGCFTCAGGGAAFDVICHLLKADYGEELARLCGSYCNQDRLREPGEQVRQPTAKLNTQTNERLSRAIDFLNDNLERDICARTLAREVALSRRQLERLFRKYFDSTPGQYYLKLRLEAARDLLRRTNRPILDVAVACGFTSTSHFTKCYREHFGPTPTKERQNMFWAAGNKNNDVARKS